MSDKPAGVSDSVWQNYQNALTKYKATAAPTKSRQEATAEAREDESSVVEYDPFNPQDVYEKFNREAQEGAISLSGEKPEQVSDRVWEIAQATQEKYLGYTPSYWEDPYRIGRAFNMIEALQPGESAPDWMDTEGIETAYDYLSYANKDKPWWEWQYLDDDDPGRELFKNMSTPPDEFLQAYNEMQFSQGKDLSISQEEQPDKEYSGEIRYGVPVEEYDQLLPWQKLLTGLMSQSPEIQGAAQGGLIGLVGGPAGALGGAAGGYVLGLLSKRYQKVADFMDKLDLGAEWVERALGATTLAAVHQYEAVEEGGFMGGANEAAKSINNLEALFKAGHLFYETLPTGKTWDIPGYLGMTEAPSGAWNKPRENEGFDAMNEAYERITKGDESLEDIYLDIQRRQGITGYGRDLLGHVLLDPLNFAGNFSEAGIKSYVGFEKSRLVKKLTTGTMSLADYTKGVSKLTALDVLSAAADVGKTPIKTAETYGAYLRSMVETKAITELDAVSRWLAGVTKEGEVLSLKQPIKVTRLDKAAGGIFGSTLIGGVSYLATGSPILSVTLGLLGGKTGYAKGLSYIVHLTPEARATEILNNSADIIKAILYKDTNIDEATIYHYVKSLKNTPTQLAGELSMRAIEAPDGSAIPLALKEFKAHDILHQMWVSNEKLRTMVNNMAKVLKRNVTEVLNDMRNSKDVEVLLRQYIDVAMKATDDPIAKNLVAAYNNKELTGAKLQQMVKAFTGKAAQPYTLDMYKAELFAAMGDHMSEWAAKWFGVTPESSFVRVGRLVKAAQSLALLGFSPTYMINNALTNGSTMIAEGVFGLRTGDQIARVWERAGFSPMRKDAGVGIASAGEEMTFKGIREAMKDDGTLTKLTDKAQDINSKLGIFSKGSNKIEQMSSAQATTTGYLQSFANLWRRGRGYDLLPRNLENMLRQIDDSIPDLIYSAIDGGMNKKEIENALWSGMANRTIDSVIPDVAAATKKTLGETREILMTSGAYDFLKENLKDAETPEAINKAFEDLAEHVNNHIDDMMKTEVADEIEKAKAKVSVEGLQSTFDTIDQMSYEYAERWFDSWVMMDKAAQEAEAAKDAGYGTSGIWQHHIGENRVKWDRHNKRVQAISMGIVEGMGLDSKVSRTFIDEGLIKIQDLWNGFYDLRDELYTKLNAYEILYEDVLKQLAEEYEKVFNAQEVINDKLDDLFTNMVKNQFSELDIEQVGNSAQAWRKGVKDIRVKMHTDMAQHRNEGLQTWREFLNSSYLKDIQNLHTQNSTGAAELYKLVTNQEIKGREAPEKPALVDVDWKLGGNLLPEKPGEEAPAVKVIGGEPKTEKPPVPAGESYWDTIEGIKRTRKDTALKIASAFGVASFDAEKNKPIGGAETHILNIVNKYGLEADQEKFKNLSDIADVDIVRRAFEAREKAKSEAQVTPVKKSKYTPPPFDINKKIQEYASKPRSELVNQDLSNYIETLAYQYQDLVMSGEPGRRVFDEGKFSHAISSSYPKWYGEIAKKAGGKRAVIKAFDKIIADRGVDVGRTVERLKELILKDMAQSDDVDILLALGDKEEAYTHLIKQIDEGVDLFDRYGDSEASKMLDFLDVYDKKLKEEAEIKPEPPVEPKIIEPELLDVPSEAEKALEAEAPAAAETFTTDEINELEALGYIGEDIKSMTYAQGFEAIQGKVKRGTAEKFKEDVETVQQYENIQTKMEEWRTEEAAARQEVEKLEGEIGDILDSLFDEKKQWFDTADGKKKILSSDENGIKIEGEDGKKETIQTNGEAPKALGDAQPGTIDSLSPIPQMSKAYEEYWTRYVAPLLMEIQQRMTGQQSKAPTGLKGFALDDASTKELMVYLNKVYGQLQDVKLASMRWGVNRRDASLLNYSKRYGWNNMVDTIVPYHFWYTGTAARWLIRALDRPSWMANYARLRRMQEQVTAQPGFPSRLQGKMKLSLPFLPEWAKGEVYIDPLHQIFSFEQLFHAYDQQQETKSQEAKRATYVIQDWIGNEQITEEQAVEAISTMSGEIWEKALAQAKIELGTEQSNPYDFVSTILSPNLPLSIASNILKGTPEKINQLPVTRTVQAVTSLAFPKTGGLNIEAPIRKAAGLPEGGELGEFYIDRELSNMVAEGLLTVEEGTRAMVERSGEAYEQAKARSAQQRAVKSMTSSLWLDFFPEGEELQRAAQQEFSAAIESGDKSALTKFFDDHPEYRARMLSNNWDDPEQRMKTFLVSEVWNSYNKLPDLTKKDLRDQLGDVFNGAFLNKETRSYDAIDNDTLAWWSQVMGGYVPKEKEVSSQIAQPTLHSAEETQAYQDYMDTKNEKYPNIYNIENVYWNTPAAEREQLLDKFPKLSEYWNWKNEYLAGNPEAIPLVTTEDSSMYGVDTDIAQKVYQYKADRENKFPNIFDTQNEYYSKSGADAKAYKKEHPELVEYWAWQRNYLANNPDTIPYIKNTEQIAESVLGKDYKTDYAVNYVFDPNDVSPTLLRQIMGYYYANQEMGSGSLRMLKSYWESHGRPGRDFDTFINSVLKQQIVP